VNPNLTPPLPSNLLPPGDECYIAGGYAACPERATDIDVWVKAPNVELLPSVRRRVLSWFSAQGFDFQAMEDSRNIHDEYGDVIGGVLKVAVITGAARLPIHVMVTDMRPRALLETFDISTHMVAWDGDETVTISYTSALEEDPIIIKMTPTTPARFDKIRNRYADLRTNG